MRVLLTGADGYIGVRMGSALLEAGHDVVGLDTGFHRVGWLYHYPGIRPRIVTGDTRDLEVDDLRSFQAVVHCAELSNDPVGELNPDVTYGINHRASVALAQKAKAAGVERFVHMSSCSVYGASGQAASSEGDPTQPLTAYARCKLLVERDVAPLAADDFSPTFLRNATAFGASPRQRFDLVVNDLAAMALLYKEIRMASDGTPWRPFVHILDIARAVVCVLAADREAVHGQILNVGDDRQNHQVRAIAETVAGLVPGCTVHVGDTGADRRDYRADFSKIHRLLPDFACEWDVERGVQEMIDVLTRAAFDEELYRFRGHTRLKQIRHLVGTGQVDDSLMWV